MLAPVNHILPLTTIERERLLPIAGTVTAKLNQKVSPTDVIGEATWSHEHLLIDVARTLGISPAAADRLLRVKEGDHVQEGMKIAIGSGIFPRAIHAEKDGRVLIAGSGQILIETGETTIQLRAGMPGTVIQIIPNRGAVIRSMGALIQGAWGNGHIDTGLLLNLSKKPDDVLAASRLDVSLRGSILLAGIVQDAATLRAAADLPVRGLILSSISPSLLPAAQKMRYPIISIEGFGRTPMNSAAYRLLTSNVKRETTLNAEPYDHYSGVRPEVFIPLPVSQPPPPLRDVDTLAPGQTVRLRRNPHAGAIGTLVNLRAGQASLPSGLRTPVAEVKLETGEQILIPLVNLEIVG